MEGEARCGHRFSGYHDIPRSVVTHLPSGWKHIALSKGLAASYSVSQHGSLDNEGSGARVPESEQLPALHTKV